MSLFTAHNPRVCRCLSKVLIGNVSYVLSQYLWYLHELQRHVRLLLVLRLLSVLCVPAVWPSLWLLWQFWSIVSLLSRSPLACPTYPHSFKLPDCLGDRKFSRSSFGYRSCPSTILRLQMDRLWTKLSVDPMGLSSLNGRCDVWVLADFCATHC